MGMVHRMAMEGIRNKFYKNNETRFFTKRRPAQRTTSVKDNILHVLKGQRLIIIFYGNLVKIL